MCYMLNSKKAHVQTIESALLFASCRSKTKSSTKSLGPSPFAGLMTELPSSNDCDLRFGVSQEPLDAALLEVLLKLLVGTP